MACHQERCTIGGWLIQWHILKLYSHYGITISVICCGCKNYVIKEYFAHYFLHTSDVACDLGVGGMEVHRCEAEPWRSRCVYGLVRLAVRPRAQQASRQGLER